MPRKSKKDASQNFDDLLSRINVSTDRLCTTKHFDNLEITLVQDLKDNASKDIKGLSKIIRQKIKAVSSLYNHDLKDLFGNLSSVTSFINNLETSSYLNDLNSTLQKAQFPVAVVKDALGQYFNELETLQNQLFNVKETSNEMGETNRILNVDQKALRIELENTKQNLERKEKKVDKYKNTINDYRKSTLQLVTTVESEQQRISNMSVDEIPDNLELLEKELQRQSNKMIENVNATFDSSFIGSPGKNINQSTNRWFDIEKSQERYEVLLNSYNKIITDKDEHIKTLFDDVQKVKRERSEIEDEYFNQIREKDRLITNAEYEKNNAVNNFKIQQKENEDRIKRLQGEINYLENRLNNLQNSEETIAPIRGVQKKLEESREQLNNEKQRYYDQKDNERKYKSQIYDLQMELEAAQKKLENSRRDAKGDWANAKRELENKLEVSEKETEMLIRSRLVDQEKSKERERDLADLKLKLADKEQDLTSQKKEIAMTMEAINELSRKLKIKNTEVDEFIKREDKLKYELDRNLNQDILQKTQRDKAIKEVEWLRDQLSDRDNKVKDLEKYVVKYEDKSLKFAKTIEKLRNKTIRSPSPHSTHRFENNQHQPKNSINAFSPFPISSTKKLSASPIRKSQAIYPMQSKSPLRSYNFGSTLGKERSASNCSADFSNMNNVFHMYKR